MPGFGHRRQRGRQVSVTVVARGGTTTTRVDEATGNFAGGIFGGVMGGIGGGSGIAVGVGLATFQSGVAAAGIRAALVGTSYVVARTVFTGTVRRRTRPLEALADRLASHAGAAVEAAAGATTVDQNGRSSSS